MGHGGNWLYAHAHEDHTTVIGLRTCCGIDFIITVSASELVYLFNICAHV